MCERVCAGDEPMHTCACEVRERGGRWEREGANGRERKREVEGGSEREGERERGREGERERLFDAH